MGLYGGRMIQLSGSKFTDQGSLGNCKMGTNHDFVLVDVDKHIFVPISEQPDFLKNPK